jgi:cell cycle sensor histidine kinase DivJ
VAVKDVVTMVVPYGAGVALMGVALYLVKRHRKSEARARIAETRWRALSDLTDIGLVRHDAKGHVIGSNAAFCRAIGINPDGLEDRTVITRLHLGSGPAFLKALSDVSHGTAIAEARVRMKCEPEAEGHYGPDPYRDFILRVSQVVIDPVTGQSEILGAYRPVHHAVEDASTDRIASLSIARFAHELRTPLTAIIGFADCLGDPAIIASDDPKRGDYARIIATSARHMLDVVASLAEEANPQPRAERVPSGSDTIDLGELIDETVDIMRLNVEAQRASLHWMVDEDVPMLVGSRHAFRQVLINLISNALKFAPDGAVLVRASRDGAKVRLMVEDNGIGVADDDMARLGEPFFRGRLAGDKAPDGQGLGLGIVRDIVREHQGDLDIMSRPGAGTRVIVTFAIPEAVPVRHRQAVTPRYTERRYA